MRRVPHPADLPLTRQTLPAELMPALPTRHMIAPLGLLDPPPAPDAGTLLRDAIEHGFGQVTFFPLVPRLPA